jgi:hypothetical protein
MENPHLWTAGISRRNPRPDPERGGT